MTDHAFDRALALRPVPGGADDYAGTASPDYWNMVGPFGGTTAAVVLQSVLRHPALLGTPIALTVNYAAAIAAGDFAVRATPVRTNRSTQHWTIDITQPVTQPDGDGRPQVTTTATVVTAARRETWSRSDLPMPPAPAPADVAGLPAGPVALPWLGQYDLRLISGAPPRVWDGSGEHSESLLWLRDRVPRPLDFAALASMSDVFFPRIWLRRATRVPAGTVSITTYFHAGAEQLAAAGSGYLLGRAVGQQFMNGFFDQAVQLWSEAGVLLATSNQIVYFKE